MSRYGTQVLRMKVCSKNIIIDYKISVTQNTKKLQFDYTKYHFRLATPV